MPSNDTPPRRPLPGVALAVALCAVGAAGCQDYQFNPVGHCLIQPGTQRVTLSSVSSADVLFVVDDSGSMAGEQAKLASAFDAFVGALNSYEDTRVGNHLEPYDFHVAITTTSIFYNPPAGATCQASCGSATNVCCVNGTSQPMLVPQACPSGAGCGSGFVCKTDCQGHAGEAICCDASGGTIESTSVPCASPGAACGRLQERYVFPRRAVPCSSSTSCASGYTCVSGCSGLTGSFCCSSGGSLQLQLACTPGIATEGALYPQGSFVGLGTNPRVLSFDKQLYGQLVNGVWQPVPSPSTATNKQGFTRQQLGDFFKANVNVGTCGSGEEQGLQGGRLAITKALAGQQLDMRDSSGAIVAAPGVKADWPHAGSKLVVVYIGDEDDCSSPNDPVRGVVLTGLPGNDSCVADAALPLDQQKEFRVSDVVSDLFALKRPLGGAFIVSTAQTSCVDAACTAGLCCDTVCTGSASVCRTDTCGGQGAGNRFLDAAGALRSGGADVVEGSICDPGNPPGTGFAAILARIAEIVKPPSALLLPTQPADAAVTLLRIVREDGTTRKTCRGPALPPLTYPQAHDYVWPDPTQPKGYDWWFTASREQITDAQKAPSTASRYVYINHDTGNCEANPGETYSADYLGQVPQGGCTSDVQCATVLGGAASDWTCFAGVGGDGKCVAPSAIAVGTCVCGGRSSICPAG